MVNYNKMVFVIYYKKKKKRGVKMKMKKRITVGFLTLVALLSLSVVPAFAAQGTWNSAWDYDLNV